MAEQGAGGPGVCANGGKSPIVLKKSKFIISL